jgi:hypothetical protein
LAAPRPEVAESAAAASPRALRLAVDVVLAVATLVMLALIAQAGLAASERRAALASAVAEARSLHEALERYRERNGAYPGTWIEPRFDPRTLAPLSSRGYYRGTLTSHLLDRSIDAYDSPDEQRPNGEYWLEMTLAADPSIRILVARSDDAPLGGGQWREGVYVYRDGALESR